ncbi:MAG: type II toxin-antitoxin system RelE/ParE family toxin [Pseudomonadota bacterium]
MNQSIACADTQRLYEGRRVARFANIMEVAERKLQQLDSAASLEFLRSPPGNRLEMLTGNRAGQHSMRINARWRLCFIWTVQGPEQVEIVDYH